MCSGERCPRRSPVKRPSAAGGSGEKPPRPAHEARGLSTPEAPSAAVDCKFSSDAIRGTTADVDCKFSSDATADVDCKVSFDAIANGTSKV